MDDRNLTDLLAQVRDAPLPPLPGTFRQDVWRTIRQRGSRSAESWLSWFFEPLFRPALAFTAIVLAALVGASMGSMALDSRGAETRQALGLQVFSSSSPTIPATLLGDGR
jgi:hypothetical protein